MAINVQYRISRRGMDIVGRFLGLCLYRSLLRQVGARDARIPNVNYCYGFSLGNLIIFGGARISLRGAIMTMAVFNIPLWVGSWIITSGPIVFYILQLGGRREASSRTWQWRWWVGLNNKLRHGSFALHRWSSFG